MEHRGGNMNKRTRQYVGLLSAVLAYYLVHEGAHFVYALSIGVFQRINFLGLGVQVAIYSEGMSNLQLGFFVWWALLQRRLRPIY